MNVPKGKIEKLSVAVLVDHRVNWVKTTKGPQKQLTAPPTEQMNTIRQLVAGSVGLNTDRGDQLVVEALPFDSTQQITAPSDELAPQRPAGWMEMLQTGDLLKQITAAAILVLAALGIGTWFLLNARKSRARVAVEHRKSLQDGQAGAAAHGEDGQLAESAAATKLLGPASARAEALLKEVRSGLATDSAASAQVLRVWLQEESRS
jgi:flagellar M-ring protein FliF